MSDRPTPLAPPARFLAPMGEPQVFKSRPADAGPAPDPEAALIAALPRLCSLPSSDVGPPDTYQGITVTLDEAIRPEKEAVGWLAHLLRGWI